MSVIDTDVNDTKVQARNLTRPRRQLAMYKQPTKEWMWCTMGTTVITLNSSWRHYLFLVRFSFFKIYRIYTRKETNQGILQFWRNKASCRGIIPCKHYWKSVDRNDNKTSDISLFARSCNIWWLCKYIGWNPCNVNNKRETDTNPKISNRYPKRWCKHNPHQ